jgi:TetR/AcrR family transcriptional regulator, transcriptional repressor for nem operon
MSDLVLEMGLEKGGIYNHFASKEELATVVIWSLEGAMMLSKLHEDAVHMRRAVDHLARYLLETPARR